MLSQGKCFSIPFLPYIGELCIAIPRACRYTQILQYSSMYRILLYNQSQGDLRGFGGEMGQICVHIGSSTAYSRLSVGGMYIRSEGQKKLCKRG
jgi:hypothetical protein